MSQCEDRWVEPVIAWFRRDLRVDDNPMLEAARAERRPLRHVFVVDPRLLRGPRAPYVTAAVEGLREQLAATGERLELLRGNGEDEVLRYAHAVDAAGVHATEDLTPFARRRDARVAAALGERLVLHPDDVCVPHELVGRPRTYSSLRARGRPGRDSGALRARRAAAGRPRVRARRARAVRRGSRPAR